MCNNPSIKAQLTALESETDLQHLLNEIYRITGNPVLCHDMSYRIIRITENVELDDPIWQEYATTGTVTSNFLEFFKEEDFLELAANTKKITLMNSDKLKYNRIFGKLFNFDSIQIGCVVMVFLTTYTEEMLSLFEMLCTFINNIINRNSFYLEYGQNYQERLINILIDGTIDDRQLYSAHVESIYINLKDHIFLGLTDLSGSELTQDDLPRVRNLLKEVEPAFKYAIYRDCIIFLASSDHSRLDAVTDLRRLNEPFARLGMRAGMSSCFENLYDLKKYYIEAENALNDGKKRDDGRLFFLHM